jgi:DNA-binding response OmpR family regulator
LISDIMFTPTQQRIMAVLADGLPHSTAEMLGCLLDELNDASCLRSHISHLRKKLRPTGQDIISQRMNGNRADGHYRLVRIMASPYDGYR